MENEEFENLPKILREALQRKLGTELIKDALGESDKNVWDERIKNLDELEAMTDEEIEEVIEKAFMFMKKGLPQEAEVADLRQKFKKEAESWDAIKAGYNLCFTISKEVLSTIFAGCPDLMAKKIELAKTLFRPMPQIYLKFAEKWKQESA